LAPAAGRADEASAPPAGSDFLEAACTSGLLVQGDENARGGDVDAATAAFGDLTGDGDAAGRNGDGKRASASPGSRTRLLRPASGDDAQSRCRGRMQEFYASASGRGFNAVIAPREVPTEELRAHADDVFAAMTPGSKKGDRLADLGRMSGEDVSLRVKFADRLFDGAGSLKNGVDVPGLQQKATLVARDMASGDAAARAAAALLGGPDPAALGGRPAARAANSSPAADVVNAKTGAGLPGAQPSLPPPAPGSVRRSVWSGPQYAAPPEPGYLRRKWNDYSAAISDVYHGKPITTEMGWASGVPNPLGLLHDSHPAALAGSTSVGTLLPRALPGISRECGRGADADYACWGTEDMAKVLADMGKYYAEYMKSVGRGELIRVGDISKRGGGPLGGHVSHQRGVDVDLRFVGGREGFDVQANVAALAALMLTLPQFHHIPGQQMILVDQSLHPAIGAGLDRLVAEGVLKPEQAASAKGALRHWPNHRDHFHVRLLPSSGTMIQSPQEPGASPAGDED
jgi:hypothetical protein